jgi:hypothetical protein
VRPNCGLLTLKVKVAEQLKTRRVCLFCWENINAGAHKDELLICGKWEFEVGSALVGNISSWRFVGGIK